MDTDQFPQNAPGAGSFKVSPIAVLRNIVRFFVFWKDAVEDFLDNDCQYIASAIAFYALFSMFPLFLAVIVVVGFVLGEDARDTQLALTREVGSILPVSGSLVRQTVEQVVRTHLATGILSFVGLLWASTAAFGAIRKGINAAWGIKETRQFFKKRFIDFILVLGAGLIVFILLFVSPAAGALRQAAQEAAPETIWATSAFWNIITRVVSPILVFVSILLLYRFMPHTK
ncbi:MAG: YihY/virulence factor BrkB family protein, partial [SAR202 cluster bacterium]|nr:YihY/virulence factor BrkB family protein [SAR202 cluster bacterium]